MITQKKGQKKIFHYSLRDKKIVCNCCESKYCPVDNIKRKNKNDLSLASDTHNLQQHNCEHDEDRERENGDNVHPRNKTLILQTTSNTNKLQQPI